MIVGAENTGKTSLLKSYQQQQFDQNIRASDSAKELTLKIALQGSNSQLELWIFDLPGKESFMGLNRMYLRDANVALVCYDVNSRESLQRAEEWITELENTAPSELLICLCGNKVDLPQPHALTLMDG